MDTSSKSSDGCSGRMQQIQPSEVTNRHICGESTSHPDVKQGETCEGVKTATEQGKGREWGAERGRTCALVASGALYFPLNRFPLGDGGGPRTPSPRRRDRREG